MNRFSNLQENLNTSSNLPNDSLNKFLSVDNNGKQYWDLHLSARQEDVEQAFIDYYHQRQVDDDDDDSSSEDDANHHQDVTKIKKSGKPTTIQFNNTISISDTFSSFLITHAPEIEAVYFIGANRGFTCNFFFELFEKHRNPSLRRQCLRYFSRQMNEISSGRFTLNAMSDFARRVYSSIRIDGGEHPNIIDLARALKLNEKIEAMLKYVARKKDLLLEATSSSSAASSSSSSLYNSHILDQDIAFNDLLVEDLFFALVTCTDIQIQRGTDANTVVNRTNLRMYEWLHPVWCRAFRRRRAEEEEEENCSIKQNQKQNAFLARTLLVQSFMILINCEGGTPSAKSISFYIQRMLLEDINSENSPAKVFDLLYEYFENLDEDSPRDLRQRNHGGFRRTLRVTRNAKVAVGDDPFDFRSIRLAASDDASSVTTVDEKHLLDSFSDEEDDKEELDSFFTPPSLLRNNNNKNKNNKRTLSAFFFSPEYNFKLENLPPVLSQKQLQKEQEELDEKVKELKEKLDSEEQAAAVATAAAAAAAAAQPQQPQPPPQQGAAAPFAQALNVLGGIPNRFALTQARSLYQRTKERAEAPRCQNKIVISNLLNQQMRFIWNDVFNDNSPIYRSAVVCNIEKSITSHFCSNFLGLLCRAFIMTRTRDLFQVVVAERSYTRDQPSWGSRQFYPFSFDQMTEMNTKFDSAKLGEKILSFVGLFVDRFGFSSTFNTQGHPPVLRLLEGLIMTTETSMLRAAVFQHQIYHRLVYAAMNEWKAHARDEERHEELFLKLQELFRREKLEKEKEKKKNETSSNGDTLPPFDPNNLDSAKRCIVGFSGKLLFDKSMPRPCLDANTRLFGLSMQLCELLEKLVNPRDLQHHNVEKDISIREISEFIFKNKLPSSASSSSSPTPLSIINKNFTLANSCPLNFVFKLIRLVGKKHLDNSPSNISFLPTGAGGSPFQPHAVREALSLFHFINGCARIELVEELANMQMRDECVNRGLAIRTVNEHVSNVFPVVFNHDAPKLTAKQKSQLTFGYGKLLKEMSTEDAKMVKKELLTSSARFFQNIPYLLENYREDFMASFDCYPFQDEAVDEILKERREMLRKREGKGDDDDQDTNNNNNNNNANNNNPNNNNNGGLIGWNPVNPAPGQNNINNNAGYDQSTKELRFCKPIDDSYSSLRDHCQYIIGLIDAEKARKGQPVAVPKESGKRRGRGE